MAARSIASLSLSFGLVSIPVKVYSATESAAGVHFNLLHKCGSRVKQQYMCIKEEIPVERSELVKGYEFEKDRYVMFSPEELKALEEGSRHTIDIVSFVPLSAVDPIYYDKAYYLAPDKRGGKPYGLLHEAMTQSGRCALATWSWKGKQYVVQVRPAGEGLVLQQLLYADEVRSMKEIPLEPAKVSPSELQLAMQLIEQNAAEGYDPSAFKDEEKARVLAAIDEKIAGKQIVVAEERPETAGAQVIDLMDALRASLGAKKAATQAPAQQPIAEAAVEQAAPAARERKGPKRAAASAKAAKAEEAAEAAPAPKRARAGSRK